MISKYSGVWCAWPSVSERAYTPRGGLDTTTPSAFSVSRARWIVFRLTLYCSASSRSDGRRWPGRYFPVSIARRRSSASCAYGGRGSSLLTLTLASVVGQAIPGQAGTACNHDTPS